jgi:dipeptidyl aminopeptidase/acylaminoacyl peptidase
MRGNMFDIGGGDRRDLMTGVDAMIARNIAHADSLAIDGWSYGAILGGYTLTKTTRFKAASLGAMVSDWVSEYGAGAGYDMERWFIGGNPWTKPEHWRERSSLTHADRVRTPTLLHHGDVDDTDSPFHSMNFFVALRKFGTIARFIRYPGEPHDLQQPKHVRIRDVQDIAWMQRFVRGIRSPESIP